MASGGVLNFYAAAKARPMTMQMVFFQQSPQERGSTSLNSEHIKDHYYFMGEREDENIRNCNRIRSSDGDFPG